MSDDFISFEEFSKIVHDFLSRSSRHEEILAEGCCVSIPTIRRWDSGINISHSPMMPFVVIFITEHMFSCVCGLK